MSPESTVKDHSKEHAERKNSFERLLSVMLFLVFILVIITGVVSYLKLNEIISTVKTSIRPDRNLILVKEIYNDLTKAENRVKSYSLSKNEEDMVHFYEITEITGNMMDKLKEAVVEDTSLSSYIDTLDLLVERKFDILDQLLILQDEYQVNQAMHEVMRSIEKRESGVEPDTLSQAVFTDTVQEPEKRESFFSRLFKKKKKKITEQQDTVVTKDTLPVQQAAPVIPTIPLEEINRQVEKVQQKAQLEEKQRKARELELFTEDRMVMDRISELLTILENKEDFKLKMNTQNAEAGASQVKSIIVTFGIAALFLLVLVSLVIYSYIKRNNEYRDILKKARLEAEQLASARQQFLANMSHEIRTPMNIISGYLKQMLQDPLPETLHEKLEIVAKSSDHLLQLLNNLLDLSRIQADRLELMETTFSPEEIISDMYRWFLPLAEEKKLRLEAYADPLLPSSVIGDPVRLRQILFNLTGNAVKFTEKGTVVIRGTTRREKPGRLSLTFEVADTGIGIDSNDLEKIFTEFEQLSSPGRTITEGAGLGLAITNKLVTLMGGKLEVDSIPGKGSTFRVTLPFILDRSGDETRKVAPEEQSALPEGLRVLVVDDEEYNRSLVRLILEKHHASVLEAESGEASVDLLEKEEVDLVLMDLRMPGISGTEAAMIIRREGNRKNRKVPVIAVSAGLVRKDFPQYREMGIDDFLEKPIEESSLIRVILRNIPKKLKKMVPPEDIPPGQEKNDSPVKSHYDLGALKDSSAGNTQFFKEMVELFLKNTDSGLVHMEVLLKQKQWQAAGEIAHKISAPCKHIKAEVLYDLVKTMENLLLHEKRPENATELLMKARKEFEYIRKQISLDKEINPV